MHDGHDHGPITPEHVCDCPPGQPCTCDHGLLKESHDVFPIYTDIDSRTLPHGQSFSNKHEYLTYHNLGNFDVEGAEIVLLDRPFDNAFDPQQTGHGFIGHSGSKVRLRNTSIRSEGAGVPGHLLFTGECAVDIEGCVIDGVGRTLMGPLDNAHLGPNREVLHPAGNQIGRYACHLHHVTVPFRIVDTKILNGRKVALAIHNSDGGLVERVIVDNFDGAGIVLEAGSENDNVIRDCRVTNIRGDGKGVQGHDGGIDAKLAGDDGPNGPRRTLGGQFSEGAGIWLRAIANNIEHNYIAHCQFGAVGWCRGIDDALAYQNGHRFSFNTIEHCPVAVSLQGTRGVFLIDHLTVRNCPNGLDFSYNETIRLEDCNLIGTGSGWPMQPGFTNRFEWINCTVKDWRGAVQIWNEGLIKGG
jgi:hypothetical protein